jgi:hypothetical protein
VQWLAIIWHQIPNSIDIQITLLSHINYCPISASKYTFATFTLLQQETLDHSAPLTFQVLESCGLKVLVISLSIHVPLYIPELAAMFHFRGPSLLYASTILFCYSSWIRLFYVMAAGPCRNMLQLLCVLYISDLIKDELLYASSECVCCLDFYSACTKSPRPYVHLDFNFEENRGTFWKINENN